jgi:hypothetical protein
MRLSTFLQMLLIKISYIRYAYCFISKTSLDYTVRFTDRLAYSELSQYHNRLDLHEMFQSLINTVAQNIFPTTIKSRPKSGQRTEKAKRVITETHKQKLFVSYSTSDFYLQQRTCPVKEFQESLKVYN